MPTTDSSSGRTLTYCPSWESCTWTSDATANSTGSTSSRSSSLICDVDLGEKANECQQECPRTIDVKIAKDCESECECAS